VGESIVVTTNKAFSEWNQVFESAACLATLIDRLCHRAEIIEIRGASYRVKASKARTTRKRKARRTR
jgi:DNA replication protein DnaC